MPRPYTPRDAHAGAPAAAPPPAAPHEGARRSFATLLAEAEAVQDRVELTRPAARAHGMRSALQGAAHRLARSAPWLGLGLLTRRAGRG